MCTWAQFMIYPVCIFLDYGTFWSRFVLQESEIDLAGRGSGLHGRGLGCAELYSKLLGRRWERVIVPTIGIRPDCCHGTARYCPLGLLRFKLKHSNTLKRKHFISNYFTNTGLPLWLKWIQHKSKSDEFSWNVECDAPLNGSYTFIPGISGDKRFKNHTQFTPRQEAKY